MGKDKQQQKLNNQQKPVFNFFNYYDLKNATFVHYTGAYLSEFIEFIPALNELVMHASASRYKTILRKYCHP